jgi:hypothetical protein
MWKQEKNNREKLIRFLDGHKLEFIKETEGYRCDIWHLKHRWTSKTFEFHWHKWFSENVDEDGDYKLEIRVKDFVIGTLDLLKLRSQKFERPFFNELSQRILEIVNSYFKH